MKKNIFCLLLTVLTTLTAQAQLSAGFTAGMNFSRIDGPSELDNNGRALEEYRFKTGFHVGARLGYGIGEYFGLRAELLFSQKGADYTYDGQSFWNFLTDNNQVIRSTGTRSTTLRIVNNYVELPLLAYIRLGRLELGGGGYFAYLVRSTGSGELRYNGVSQNGIAIQPFTVALDFNYFDDAFKRTDAGETQPIQVDSRIIQVPKTIGSQYEVFSESKNKLFQETDYGLIGNLAFYLNRGLALGLRLNYGLQDLSRTAYDVSRASLGENREYLFREDFDRNLTLQASVGFGF